MPKEKTTAPLEEDVSSSWRIPLLKYGNESTTGKAFVELHVRAERVSAALSSPDIIASHHDDWGLGTQALQLKLGDICGVELTQDSRVELLHSGFSCYTLSASSFKGCFLQLPLLQGRLTLRVTRRARKTPELDFEGLLAAANRGGQKRQDSVCICHADLMVGDLKPDFGEFQWLPLAHGQVPKEASPGTLLAWFEVALAQPRGPALQVAARVTETPAPPRVTVGDHATLALEEALLYPTSRKQHQDSLAPGSWDESRAGTKGVPLRLPRTILELVQSDLPDDQGHRAQLSANLLRKPPPCEQWPDPEPVPVKFAIRSDENECDFRRRGLPATWQRVQEALAQAGRRADSRKLVESLTHALRQVSVQVLALRSDSTCDVELSPGFVQNWQAHPARRYCLPGTATALGEPLRLVLSGVPLEMIQAKHSASFPVYDASTLQPEDAIVTSKRKAGCIVAGPVPLDVALSRHEWMLHLRVDNEQNLHRLVANIRQCVRLQTEVSKLPEGNAGCSMGQLEVLLVRAKNVFPRRVCRSVTGSLDAIIGGKPVMQAVKDLLQPEQHLRLFVRLRLFQGEKVLSILGEEYFDSPVQEGSISPCWTGLDHDGIHDGWAFNTLAFDPARMSGLVLELELCNQSLGGEDSLGKVRIPVTHKNFLTNAQEPFRNLWLPLTSEEDGKWMVTQCGDIHILTLWQPLGPDQPPGQAPGTYRRSSAMAYLKHQVRQQLDRFLCGAHQMQICGCDGQVPGTDTSILTEASGCSPQLPQATSTPSEALFKKVLVTTMSFARIGCAEHRSQRAWAADKALEEILGRTDLGQELIQMGIPESLRPKIWLELASAGRWRSDSGVSFASCLDAGKRLLCTPLQQLQEDCLEVVGWTHVDSVGEQDRKLLHQARRICMALIGFAVKSPEGQTGPGISYCESLLAIAFHMLAGARQVPSQSPEVPFTEEDVFWLMIALAHGAYRDFFLSPPISHTDSTDTWGQGPAEDALLLDCALAVHEPQLRAHLAALGAPAGAVFWPHFNRLFAGVLLSVPLRRFWDLLLGELANPDATHPRLVLVELAFGILQGHRDELFRCQSASELQQYVSACFASLCDPEDMLDLISQSKDVLWQGFSRHQVFSLWQTTSAKFIRFYWQHRQQDLVIRKLCSLNPFTGETFRLSLDFVLQEVLPVLDAALPDMRRGGALRQVPEDLLDLMLGEGLASTGFKSFLATLATVGATALGVESHHTDGTPEMPHVKPWVCGREVPETLTSERWAVAVEQLPGWRDQAEDVFAAFCWDAWSRIEHESNDMSLNEFVAVMICCCHGTAAQKAAGLFELFAEPPRPEMLDMLPHRIPISRMAHQLSGNAESEEAEASARAVCARLPPPADPKMIALQIEVWANEICKIGDAFIRSLWPFTMVPIDDLQDVLRTGLRLPICSSQGESPSGELHLGISWLPRNRQQTPEVGTLSICVGGVRFKSASFKSAAEASPWVQVFVYDKEGQKRSPAISGQRCLGETDGLLPVWAQSSLDKTMVWEAKDASWQEDGQQWQWAPKLLQSSSSLRLPPEKVRPHLQRNISLQSCRLVAEALVRRGTLYLTCRQVAQLADRCFHRHGDSASILEALLLEGKEHPPATCEMQRYCDDQGRPYMNVTSHITLEMEKQMFDGCGSLNLSGQAEGCLDALQITDPFPGTPKLLYLRFVRAGDGQCCTAWVELDGSGCLVSLQEVDMDSSSYKPHLLNKEEFISCILAFPEISEPLRRQTSLALARNGMPLQEETGALTLDVVVEPTQESSAKPLATLPLSSKNNLPVLFGEDPSGHAAPLDGAGHGVKVFINDTLWEFLAKVQEACAKLSSSLADQGGLQDASDKYKAVAIGWEQTVLAFVPHANPKESLQALVGAHADAASWMVLDKDCTFQNYNMLYRDDNMPPCLKVVRRSALASGEEALI